MPDLEDSLALCEQFEEAGAGPLLDLPPAPASIGETGLDSRLLVQQLVKLLFTSDEMNEASASQRLKLPYPVVGELFRLLRAEKLCDLKGAAGTSGLLHRYALTEEGRARARDFMEVNQYTGPAPVPLAQYAARVNHQSVANLRINRRQLEDGLAHLVLAPDLIDQLGVAVNSGAPIFLYGESGNGKTVIAEMLGELFGHLAGSEILVPYALEADHEIIQVYDPVIHAAVKAESGSGAAGNGSGGSPTYDARWVVCQRPIVFVGGELTLPMLDLLFNPVSKYYEAPPQVKASGGVFIIDDFGRQQVRPHDLLNRWIVPLEKRMDYLTLHTGKKYCVPFDTLVVFATNLDPHKLADEAFLRRMRNKIYVGDPTLEDYMEIFQRHCHMREIPFDPGAVEYLYREYYKRYGISPRSCHPRDLIEQVVSIAKFQGTKPSLDHHLLDRACQIYLSLKIVQPETSSSNGGKAGNNGGRRSPHQAARRFQRFHT